MSGAAAPGGAAASGEISDSLADTSFRSAIADEVGPVQRNVYRLIRLLAPLALVSAHADRVAVAADAESSRMEASAETLTPCQLPDLSREARCGAVEVPENRAARDGRRLSIGVAVVPASRGRSHDDPIVVLMGGPGEDAISAASFFAEQFGPLLEDRDLLLVDQRGTGKSNALRCTLYSPEDPEASLRDFYPPMEVERCARQLAARADLTQYTYAHFAQDLEFVRRTLGFGPMNLFAGSYGARAAQVFIRMYPQSVRTVYFGSAVPIDTPTPPTFAGTTEGVLERTLGACATNVDCRRAFPNVREELKTIVARLDAGEVRVTVPGRNVAVRLDRGRVLEWFRALLYRPSSAVELPWLIHRAHQDDWNPIVEGILEYARNRDSAASLGLFFTITCNEDVAFLREEDVRQATRDTLLGDYRPRQQIAACKHWPKVSLPNDYRKPVRSDAPTMFVSGDTDAASPLWFTERVARGFPNRLEVLLAGRGHTEWSECVGTLYERFVRSGRVVGLDPAICKPAPRPPFRTE